MYLLRPLGSSNNVFRVKLRHSTTQQGLTGLAYDTANLIIGTICDNESAATAYTGANIEDITTLGTFAAPSTGKCRFKEVDSTNFPGLYEIHLANARFAVSNAKVLRVSIVGAANLLGEELIVQLQGVDVESISRNATAANNVESVFTGHGADGDGVILSARKLYLTNQLGDYALEISGGVSGAHVYGIEGSGILVEAGPDVGAHGIEIDGGGGHAIYAHTDTASKDGMRLEGGSGGYGLNATIYSAPGVSTKTYTLTNSVGGTPLANVQITVSTDNPPTAFIAQGYTDVNGQFTFSHNLSVGTPVYIWRSHPGYSFTDPDTERL